MSLCIFVEYEVWKSYKDLFVTHSIKLDVNRQIYLFSCIKCNCGHHVFLAELRRSRTRLII